MTLQGYQFDKAKVTPEADAQLYSYLARSYDNKVISGLTVTATGLNVYVAAGKALVQGRLVENGQQAQLTAQANKIGYVCIVVDLTQTNTSTGTPGTSNYVPVNNQLRLELVEVLNQQDLNNGGLIYTFPIYSYTSTGTSINLTKIKRNYFTKSVTAIVTGLYNLTLTITRIDDTIELVSDRIIINGAVGHEQSAAGFTIPLGFRPISKALVDIKMNNGFTMYNPMLLRIDSNGTTWLTNEAVANNRFMQSFATWKTNDPWPDL